MSLATISILGCGWLGLPLAETLVKTGHPVKGSTTNVAKLPLLKEKGIEPYLISLTPTIEADKLFEFLDSEILILNIPPGTKSRSAGFHIEQIDNLIPHLIKSKVKKIVYTSSTSVYPDLNKEVTEVDCDSFVNAGNSTLAVVENRLQNLPNIQTTVIRLGGLTGYNRLLIRHFAGKKNLSFGEEPVNLIHRDDAIGVIQTIIQQEKWGKTYNACSPIHPLKKDFYLHLADQHHFERPDFITTDKQAFKLVNADKLVQETGYIFHYPDPMKYRYE